jgi:hypothetical protein
MAKSRKGTKTPNVSDENVAQNDQEVLEEVETAVAAKAPSFGSRSSGQAKRPPRSLSKKSGVVFPVLKIRKALRRGRYAKLIQTGEKIILRLN